MVSSVILLPIKRIGYALLALVGRDRVHVWFEIGAKGGAVTFPHISNVAGNSVNHDFFKPHILSCAGKCGALHSGTGMLRHRGRI